MVTVSIGVTAHQVGDTIDAILARIDKALYQAKRDGRNCVRIAVDNATANTSGSPMLVAAG